MNSFKWLNYDREVKLYTCLPGTLGINDELTLAEAAEWEKGLSTAIEVWPAEEDANVFWLNLKGDGPPNGLLSWVKGSGGVWSKFIF